MLNVSFYHNEHRYVRINRTKALKALKMGYTLVVYNRLDNPNSPWNSPSFWSMGEETPESIIGIDWDTWVEYTFKKLESNHEFYNGDSPWWYIGEHLAENL